MNKGMTISAVIPTFNRGATLPRAITSVLEQQHPPEELIVVDDGSTDGTEEIVRRFGSAVRYVRQRNQGVSSARRTGLAHASCAWIAYLDSDDYWLPPHLLRLREAMAATDLQACCYFADLSLRGTGRTYWEECGFKPTQPWTLTTKPMLWAVMRTQPTMLQACAIRTSLLLQIQAFSDELRTREDTLLFFQLALRQPFCAVAGCGTVFADDGASRLTDTYTEEGLEFHDATVFLYRKVVEEARSLDHQMYPQLRRLLASAYADRCVATLRSRSFTATARGSIEGVFHGRGHFVRLAASRLSRRLFFGPSIPISPERKCRPEV